MGVEGKDAGSPPPVRVSPLSQECEPETVSTPSCHPRAPHGAFLFLLRYFTKVHFFDLSIFSLFQPN